MISVVYILLFQVLCVRRDYPASGILLCIAAIPPPQLPPPHIRVRVLDPQQNWPCTLIVLSSSRNVKTATVSVKCTNNMQFALYITIHHYV